MKEKRRVSADVYSDEKPPEVTVLSAPLADIPATPAPAYLPLPVAASPIPGIGLIATLRASAKGQMQPPAATHLGHRFLRHIFVLGARPPHIRPGKARVSRGVASLALRTACYVSGNNTNSRPWPRRPEISRARTITAAPAAGLLRRLEENKKYR